MAEELEQPVEPVVPERNERFKWYILHAYSGFERKVRESIQSRIYDGLDAKRPTPNDVGAIW